MSTGPEVGEIRLGGGVAEQYIGNSAWRKFREDERTCPLERYGKAHAGHRYDYIYTRREELGGITTGHYWCDGLPEDREPFPLCPLQGAI